MNSTTRRTFLRNAMTASAVSGLAVPGLAGTAASDARLEVLSEDFWRAEGALIAFINETEQRHGACAYDSRPEFRPLYDRLTAQVDDLTAEIGSVRPDSLGGLVVKMRVALLCRHLDQAPQGCIAENVFFPALRDLERLAVA